MNRKSRKKRGKLIACPRCGADTSSEAITCPHCGHPGGGMKQIIIAIGVVLWIVLILKWISHAIT